MIFAPRIQIEHVNNRLHALECARKNFQPTSLLTFNANIEKKSFVRRFLLTRDDDNPRNDKDRNDPKYLPLVSENCSLPPPRNVKQLRSLAEHGAQQDAAGTNRRATPFVSPKAVVMTRNVRNSHIADHTHGSKVAARGCFGIQAAHGSAHSASRRGSAQARRSRMVTCTCEGPSDLMLPPPTRDPCAWTLPLRPPRNAARALCRERSRVSSRSRLLFRRTSETAATLDKHSGRWALSLSFSLAATITNSNTPKNRRSRRVAVDWGAFVCTRSVHLPRSQPRPFAAPRVRAYLALRCYVCTLVYVRVYVPARARGGAVAGGEKAREWEWVLRERAEWRMHSRNYHPVAAWISDSRAADVGFDGAATSKRVSTDWKFRHFRYTQACVMQIAAINDRAISDGDSRDARARVNARRCELTTFVPCGRLLIININAACIDLRSLTRAGKRVDAKARGMNLDGMDSRLDILSVIRRSVDPIAEQGCISAYPADTDVRSALFPNDLCKYCGCLVDRASVLSVSRRKRNYHVLQATQSRI